MSQDPFPLPLVSLRSLGGTVAMTSPKPGQGAAPSIDAAGLIEAVPALDKIAVIEAASFCQVPGASLEFELLVALRDDLEKACSDGAAGLVVTQGTDTLEESAFLLDLLWPRREPIVFTGAMRTADSPGADGPANLVAAVSVAASPSAMGRGTLVVMNDEIHPARTVRKSHTASPSAFVSPSAGPVGRVHEGRVIFHAPPNHRETFQVPADSNVARVGLVRVCLGDDTFLLERAMESYDGLVVEALGGGHVPSWWVEPLLRAAKKLPVVLASRVGSGALLETTYDFPGSERQLLAGGLIPAEDLDGIKARILLSLAITASSTERDIAVNFSRAAQRRETWTAVHG